MGLTKCLLFALLTGFSAVAAQDHSQKQEGIEYIKEAKEVHEEWVDRLKNCGNTCNEFTGLVGTIEHHEEWVRRYGVVLEVLR
jgi:hypothetical protein